MANWQESAKKSLDNRKNNTNNTSSATSAPAVVSAPKAIDAPKSTDTWQGKAQQSLNKRGYVPPENRMYSLKTNDGQDFGVVSYGAYKAIENNNLDSYTPKTSEEKASLDNFKAYAQEQYEKQQEAEKQKRINSNPTFARYNIDPAEFDYDDLIKWAGEHNHTMRVDGSMRTYFTPNYKGGFLGIGGKKLSTDEEDADMEVLYQTAMNNTRADLAQQDLGVFMSAIAGFGDGMSFGAISKLSDWSGKKQYEDAGLDSETFVSPSQTYAKTVNEHGISNAVGDIGGSLVSLGAVGKVVGTATKGIKWLSSAPKWVQSAVNSGVTFATVGATETAFDGGNAEEILRSAGINLVGGAVGGSLSSVVGSIGEKFLFNKGLQHKVIPEIIRNGLSSAAYAGGNTLATSFLYPEGYKPAAEEVAKDLAVAFAFGSISSAINITKTSAQNKKYLDSLNSKMAADYEQMARANISNKSDIAGIRKFAKNVVGYSNAMEAYLTGKEYSATINGETYTFTPNKVRLVGQDKYVQSMLNDLQTIRNNANAVLNGVGTPTTDLATTPGTTPGATPTASVPPVSSAPSSVPATKEAVAPVNVAEAPQSVPPVVSTPVIDEATPTVKNTNDFTDELSEVASAGAVSKYAPESANADVVSLENKLINVGASDVDRQKVVETAIAVESTLVGTDKTLKDVLADTTNITGSAVTAFKQSVGAPKNYWSLFNTNLKTIAALQTKENFIADYANAFAETLQSTDSVMSKAVVDSGIDVASAVSQYALMGSVPEEVKNETVLSGLSKAFTAITEPVLNQIDTAHIAIYGDARTEDPTPEMPAETQTAPTEAQPATTNELQPEEAQKYNIVVSNLKRKAEELGLLDSKFFTALQDVDLYKPSASDRALISSEFRRVFADNTDALVTNWLDSISEDAQPVTTTNSKKAVVTEENTPVNTATTNTEVNSGIVTLKKPKSIYNVFRGAEKVIVGADMITDGKIAIPLTDNALKAVKKACGGEVTENNNYSLDRVVPKNTTVEITGDPKLRTVAKNNGTNLETYVFKIGDKYYSCPQKYLDAVNNGKNRVFANETVSPWVVNDEKGNFVAVIMPVNATVTDAVYDSLQLASEKVASDNAHKAALKSAPFNKNEKSYLFSTGRIATAEYDGHTYITNGGLVIRTDPASLDFIKTEFKDEYGRDITNSDAVTRSIEAYTGFSEVGKIEKAVEHNTYHPTKKKKDGTPKVEEYRTALIVGDNAFLFDKHFMDMLKKRSAELKILSDGQMKNTALVGYDTNGDVAGLLLPMLTGKGDLFVKDSGKKYYFLDKFKVSENQPETEPVTPEKTTDLKKEVKSDTIKAEEKPVEAAPVEEAPKETYTPKAKEDFKVGDVLEFDGEQWKCVGIDTMMIDFENVNKDAFQRKMSAILPYELFKEKTDYKVVKSQGEATTKPEVDKKPAENKEVVPTTKQQTDISKKAVNDVAEFVRGKLESGSKISSTALFDTAKAAYGGSMADGVFTPKDAYDAMELGVNKYILSLPSASTQKMLDILELLPTQTKRTEEMIKYQQFSTPPSIAYLANYVANINSNDVMLEPSAGIGGIAVFAKRDGATVYVNELDPRRLDIVKELPFDGFYNENAEQIDNILGGEIQPSVIVMNPPFSSSSERNIKGTKIGAKHIEQALQILAPGGRLVAIVGNGMAPDAPAFRQWWKDISAKYNVKANIGINGKNYTKYGTNFNIQMLVIDKDGSTTAPTKVGTVDTLQELESMLGGIRDERPTFDYSKLERTTPGAVEQKATAISKAGDQRNDAVLDTSSTAGSKQPTDGAVSSREPKREVAPKTSSKPGSTSAATPTATDTTANEPGLTGTREPGGSVGVQDSNGAVNGADKQSDLQPGLQGSDGNSRNGLAPSRVSRLKHTELTDSIFEQYQTAPLLIEGAKQHPAKVSESAAMSAIEAPAITYKPTLPQKVITDGVVSDVQLESISRAGQSHSQILPNGTRRGYFMGDGTGIGKGRTIAGIILDNYNQGRKKAVWVTLNSSLVNDAKRDVKAVFGSPDLVTQFVGGNKADQIMGQDEGILVVSYSSLSRAFDSPGSNFEKIVKWLGKDFDGVIVFDEAHKMGNSSDTKGSRGVKKASQTGLSGIAFQEALPKARIVYSSATGATEVENLRYAERLGLWGDGTAFASGDDFVSKIKAGGLAAMELVARDLKAMGVYLSRNISYDGVEYDKIEHTLTPQQEQIYNELARSWQVVLQNINKALETTNQSKDGHARGRALGAFWSSQQRFFNQILTSMQAPSVIADIEKQLAAGKSCVIQLVSTNESAQNEEFARLQAEDLTLEDFDLTPKQMLMSFIEKSFPVQQFEDYVDDNGNKRSKPVYDSKGKPVLNREAIKQRDELLAKLGSIKVPSSPIDMIISHFGTDMVAENTGRQRRVIEKNGKMIEEKIGSKKDADVDAFQNGKKRIIIFSKAGGTGKSYHADKSAKNQQQRVHYVYEPGWQADNAVQGFGRTNRSNQAVPPIYKLVTTNLKGQMRFISTIAKRLDQLGAMTKGQRQAGSTGLFSSEDNLESALASDVLAVFYKDLARDSAEGVDDGLAILEKLGLKDKIIDEYGSIITTAPELREVNKFLNRILTLETHEQNAVFDCYSNRLQEATEIAKQNGTLDKGLENYKADKISLNEEKDIREDESTGATTKYYNLTAEHKLHPTTFADVETNRSNFVGFYQHRTNQSVRAVFKTSSTTDQYGNVHNNFKFVGPAKYDYAPELRLYSNWEKIEEAEAKKLWDAELAMLPEYRKENLHLIGGVVLPVWDKLPDENVRIYRVLTDKGDMLIGRVVPEDRIDETLRRLGSSRTKEAVPTKDIIAGIKRGDTVYLDNGWRIVQRKVANENRIEIIGPEYFNYDKLKSKGVFSERISYNTRYFIPAGDNAVSVLDEVLKISPVLRVENTRLALGGINDERGSSASESEEWRDFQPTSKKGKPIFTERKGNLGRLGRKKYCESLKADEVEYKTVNGAIRTNFVKEYAYNDDMKNIVGDLQEQGYKKVGFYVGDAHLLYSPGAQCGAIVFGEDGVFDEIYIRYDDPDYSPRQLGLHEVGHQIYNTPYGQKIANIIKNSMSFTERARVISSERYQRYMAALEDEDLVFEEFVCDILGGMTKYADMFEDIATAFRNNDTAYIDNYKVSEYNKLIDTGDSNASVLESVGLGNDYRLSESFGDIPYREYMQLRNYIVQKNNSTDALLSIDCKEIGDNFYIWNNTSKTDFTVVGSIPIVGNEDFINAIRSEITNGTYRGTENFSTRVNRIRSGKRGRAVLDGRTSRSATDGNNDRLSVRQPESDTRRNLVENSGTDTPVSQTFKSAGTSLNQVAALFKNKHFHPGKINIDIGGGKFDATSNFLRSLGTENYVFDPFNRTEQENTATLDFLMSGKKADTATCANVLNVIDTEAARLNVILETAKAIKPDGTAYFTVYTSDNSGVGRQTQADSWQNARKTEDYVSEIETYFNNVSRKGNIIIAKEPKADLPQASWEVKPGKAFRYAASENTGLAVDAAYLTAVRSGDMETAQNMVESYAKQMGYTTKVYHGTTSFGFTKIDLSKSDDVISFFATSSVDLAQTYSGRANETLIKSKGRYTEADAQNFDGLVNAFVDKVNRVAGTEVVKVDEMPFYKYLNQVQKDKSSTAKMTSTDITNYVFDVLDKIENHTKISTNDNVEIWKLADDIEVALHSLSGHSGNYGLYANTDGFLEINGNGAKWSSIPFDKIPNKNTANTREVVKWAKDNGYKGVVFKNIYDVGYHGRTQTKPADVYAFLNPKEQLKSADPITYGAFGKVIPLSKRFNAKKKDIRYAALGTYDTDSESLTPERKKQIFEQFEKDRAGMPKQTQKEIWGERASWIANNMTRVFPEIPERGEEGIFFAEFRKNMIQWKNLANTASFMVQDKLNKMTDGLTPEEFKTFSELVYFLDLQEEAQIQRERGYSEILLPNEITPGEVDEIIKVLNEEATENVRQALIKRQNIWDELKDQYIALNQYIGFDTDGKFKRKNYYHHQIIEYMNGKGTGTGSREIGIKAGRGWLKERQGSTKAINTDFLAVEYKAMLQMQYDAYIANMLGKIKKQYDIKPQLEQQAFKSNKQLLNEIIAKEATDKDGNILYDQKGQPDSETYRQQLWYNQRIMFGFNGLFDLAERNALPTFDGEYSAVVNALKMHNLNVAGLYKYVGVLANMELPENATDAQEQALINSRTVLKYTAKKRAWIKELLGDRYQTWETLAREMSDTHTIHQPRRGNYFYTKTTIDEDAFNKAFNEMILSLTSGEYSFESVDDVKKLFTQYADTVRLMGAAYEQWVLPKEIVSTMDSVANPKQSHSMAQAARGIVSAWKGWATSVNPLRTIKFGLRNLYGDLDAVIAGKPQVVKYSKRAAQEIYQAMRHKKYTPEFMEWVERGGYTSMIFANEMDAEMQDKLFAHLKDKDGKGIFNIPAKIFEGYYDGVKTAHDFREAILRYSAYLYFKETINKNGGVVKDNVASNRYIVKGLQSVEDKAYQLSKDLLGAYDEVGKMGQTLRRYWIPFYSFTETNLKRYYRMFENIIASNDDIPKKAGKLLLKALMVNMLGLLMIAWNKLVMKDVDDQLPPSVRNVPHLTLGKYGDDVYAFRQLGSFSEILEWIGLDDYEWTSEDFVAPLDKAWGMITPFVKLPVELASGLNFYPSLTEPRAIRDKWQHFFNSLGVDDIYSEVTGKPTRGVGEIIKGGFVYNYDYQESAYYEILDIKRNYQGSNDNTIYGTDAKSNALYYMKTAIRYNDKKAALKYLDEYFEHGGTGKGVKQSFATLNPMYGYTSKDTIEKGNAFVASLTEDEKEKLKIAQDFYEKELMLPESVSSRLGKKDITDEEAKNLLRNYINAKCK